MFQSAATMSSRSSSSRSGNSCGRNSSMPSLRMRSPLSPKTSYNPLFRHSDALTSFDASHFIFKEQRRERGGNNRRHPILRRYNSHDSHAHFDQITAEETTPESTKSRTTPETSPENTNDRAKQKEYEARDFLEKYSLPRVIRVDEGEPLLLYRCFDSFTKVQVSSFVGKKGKEKPYPHNLQFPEGYSGWFSLTNDKGEKSAVTYSSILQLVREQVCSFISLQPFTAYAGHNPDPAELPGKLQYLKTQIRSGQLFQLRAVFQHRDRLDGGRHSTKSSHVSKTARDKDLANRYAQLISQNNQEYYVPLTTKGEFYEIHSSMKARLCFQGLLDKTGPLALDKDCLYKITHLLRRVALPIKVKLLAGPLPPGLPKDFSDTFILDKKMKEPLMVTCTLPVSSENASHQISCINMNSSVKISKCTLGFDSENRLFKSQRLQTALAFCHKNVENWYREVRIAPDFQHPIPPPISSTSDTLECADCQKLNEACEIHKKKPEDVKHKQMITKEMLDKFQKSKKWYRHLKILGVKSEYSDKSQDLDSEDLDSNERIKSIERYKDMSRLIEERFGKKSYNPVKKSASFMFSTKRIDLEETPGDDKDNPALLKCQSLDTQLYGVGEPKVVRSKERRISKSNGCDGLHGRLQESGHKIGDRTDCKREAVKVDLDEIKPAGELHNLKKTKPDLIPTLPKEDNSYITDRLCSEFHVKTKVQKRTQSKVNLSNEKKWFENQIGQSQHILNVEIERENKLQNVHKKSVVVVQVHEVSRKKHTLEGADDIPYSEVADNIREKTQTKKTADENIYAEICENSTTCDSRKMCQCRRTKNSTEYCYVKLGSNGDSVTQSDSDEAIYNTLR